MWKTNREVVGNNSQLNYVTTIHLNRRVYTPPCLTPSLPRLLPAGGCAASSLAARRRGERGGHPTSRRLGASIVSTSPPPSPLAPPAHSTPTCWLVEVGQPAQKPRQGPERRLSHVLHRPLHRRPSDWATAARRLLPKPVDVRTVVAVAKALAMALYITKRCKRLAAIVK